MTTTTTTTTTITLPATPPFDFAASLRFLCGFPATSGEQRIDDGVLREAVRAGGTTAGLRIAAGPAGLECAIGTAGPLPDAARAEIADRVRFRFGLSDDLAPFYALAAADPPFGDVVRRRYGYHQVKFGSPLELLVWAILGQRTPMAVARASKRAIVEAAGNTAEVDGTRLWAFPDLAQLMAFGEQDLSALVRNVRKARYLHGALHGWAELDEGFLRHGDHEQVRAALLGLPGIGPWSASFLMIRGLGRTERMGPDREALAAAGRVYGHAVDEAEFTRLATRYGDWQGYWGHYLRVA